ncbi:MAG TPA: DUF4926 domain-containing protein [Candidatus Kapabacteria bacterium]|jgi:hypothetical protein
MKYDLFSEVALTEDIAQHGLKRGDVATVVESIEARPNGEPAYALEVFNAVGETVVVLLAKESQIEPLRSDELWHIRPMAAVV